MNGIHDLGGMHGFGPIPIKDEDYVFKYDWQRKSFGLTQALAGNTPFCADQHRYKIEQIAPVDYLTMDYFEKWNFATSELLKDAGLASKAELESGEKIYDVDLKSHAPVSPNALVDVMKTGMDYTSPIARAPKFGVGDMVQVREDCPETHTRVPKYVRGKSGRIVKNEGSFQFADSVALGQGSNPQYCYCAAFEAQTLWGSDAEPNGMVYLDLAEAYLR